MALTKNGAGRHSAQATRPRQASRMRDAQASQKDQPKTLNSYLRA